MSERNVILADCPPEELSDFLSGFDNDISWTTESSISNYGRKKRINNLRRYVKYFLFPFSVFVHRKRYARIVGWQQFYVLCFCFFCSVFHVKKTQKLVVALNFTYKEKNGLTGRLYKWFIKRSTDNIYIDYIHVPSKEYAIQFSREFHIPEQKMVVCPFGVIDRREYLRNTHMSQRYDLPKEYALSIGRSNRDYEFLIDVWKDIDIPLVIVCDETNTLDTSLPDNVLWLNDVHGDSQYPLIGNSSLVILCMKDGSIPSGDTVLLTAMALERKIIVTRPSTLAEMYIIDHYNGRTVEKEKEAFIDCLYEALKDNKLSENARQDYETNYSLCAMGRKIAEATGTQLS